MVTPFRDLAAEAAEVARASSTIARPCQALTGWGGRGGAGRLASAVFRASTVALCLDVWSQAAVKTAGRNISNLRYADNTTLRAESED